MRLFIAGIALACASLAFADTITMKNGDVIKGTFLGGTARQVRVYKQTLEVCGLVQRRLPKSRA